MQLSEEWIKDFAEACGMLDGPVAMSDCLIFANGVLARAQADARPVAEWQVRYMGDPRQPGIWSRSNNPDWCERQYKAIGSASNSAGYQVRPLYTHPEASAPGLSDADLRYVQRVLESDAPPEDRQRARDLIVKTRLTRASAATTTPSSVRKALQYALSELGKPPFGGVVDCTPIMQALIDTGGIDMNASAATVAEPSGGTPDTYPARLLHESDASLAERVDSWHKRHPQAAQQQAEPGADESEQVSSDYIASVARECGAQTLDVPGGVGTVIRYNDQRITNFLNRFANALRADQQKEHASKVQELLAKLDIAKREAALWKSNWEAAQSGQRAGVAENAPFEIDQTAAERDVIAERERQKAVEGWTFKHDDEHSGGEMAEAAICYIQGYKVWHPSGLHQRWPWALEWWKPKDYRRNLVRAAALVIAEIERLDRAAAPTQQEGGK